MKITPEKILSGAKKAMCGNIFKLADPEIYDKVPYEAFRGAILGHKKEQQLSELLDSVVFMEQYVPEKADKIYVYFILSLSELLYEG